MQDVINMIYTYKCQEHKLPLERICIKVECYHMFRGLCRRCPKLDDIYEIYIVSLLDFMEEQLEKSSNKECYKAKATIYQKFMRLRGLTIECLDQLQAHLESTFYSISENFIAELRTWGIRAQAEQGDTQALGDLLSRTIQAPKGQNLQLIAYQLQLKNNNGNGLIEAKNLIGQISNNLQMKSKPPNQEQQEIYSEYQLSKTFKVEGKCNSLCFNHDGTQLAVVVQDNKIEIFNYLPQEQNWTKYQELLIGHEKFIYQVKFNHDSTQILSCNENGLIIIYGKQLNGKWIIKDSLQINDIAVYSICFNHNSTLIASGSCDSFIQIYKSINGEWQNYQKLTRHEQCITVVCFNHNSTLLASGSGDTLIILWELNHSEQWEIQQILIGHTDSIQALQFNTESTQIVSGGGYLVKVWSVNNQGLWECSYTLDGHTDDVLSAVFNRQSNIIVSNSKDRTTKIWKINSFKNWECARTINSIAVSRGIIINKSNHIFISSKHLIQIFDCVIKNTS